VCVGKSSEEREWNNQIFLWISLRPTTEILQGEIKLTRTPTSIPNRRNDFSAIRLGIGPMPQQQLPCCSLLFNPIGNMRKLPGEFFFPFSLMAFFRFVKKGDCDYYRSLSFCGS
jgi:hypothetical protein